MCIRDRDGYEAHYGLNVAKVVEIGRRQPVTAMPEMRHKALLGAFLHRNGRIEMCIRDSAC